MKLRFASFVFWVTALFLSLSSSWYLALRWLSFIFISRTFYLSTSLYERKRSAMASLRSLLSNLVYWLTNACCNSRSFLLLITSNFVYNFCSWSSLAFNILSVFVAAITVIFSAFFFSSANLFILFSTTYYFHYTAISDYYFSWCSIPCCNFSGYFSFILLGVIMATTLVKLDGDPAYSRARSGLLISKALLRPFSSLRRKRGD